VSLGPRRGRLPVPRPSRWPAARRGASIVAGLLALAAVATVQWLGSRGGAADTAGSVERAGRAAVTVRRADFDFYLLALTLEPAFCEDGNQRIGQCRRLDRAAFERTPLVLHGLWPERRRPGAYPVNCPGPPLALDAATQAGLRRWMPGASEGLERHQWRKHGTCTGLDDDAYFERSFALVERANAALGAAVRDGAGRRVSAAALRAAADRAAPGFGRSVVFMCKNLRSPDPARRGRPYLYEARLCVDDDGPAGAPGTLLDCAAVGRRDQGCGEQFWIDDV
jgi:ribonuclease T2